MSSGKEASLALSAAADTLGLKVNVEKTKFGTIQASNIWKHFVTDNNSMDEEP
jgi:hypothetical protein